MRIGIHMFSRDPKHPQNKYDTPFQPEENGLLPHEVLRGKVSNVDEKGFTLQVRERKFRIEVGSSPEDRPWNPRLKNLLELQTEVPDPFYLRYGGSGSGAFGLVTASGGVSPTGIENNPIGDLRITKE